MYKPKCPYCGDKMELMIVSPECIEGTTTAWYQCVVCESSSPTSEYPANSERRKIKRKALALAMHRAETKNRVLAFDEVAKYADLPEMTLMWLEVKFAKNSCILQEIPIGFNGELMQFLEVNSASLYTHKHNYPPEDYGSRWRCWLRKPTKKEMEATPWES